MGEKSVGGWFEVWHVTIIHVQIHTTNEMTIPGTLNVHEN